MRAKSKKGKGKGIKGITGKLKEWWAKAHLIKTESNMLDVDIGNGEKMDFLGCPSYTNLKTGFTTTDMNKCQQKIRKEGPPKMTGVPQFSQKPQPSDFQNIRQSPQQDEL